MRNLRPFLCRTTALLLLALLSAGCTAEMRKMRHMRRAENFYKEGDYEKAKIEYLNVLRSDPKYVDAFRRIGEMWLEQGAPLKAGPFLARVREIEPNDLENRMRLAQVFLSVGAADEARKEALAILGEKADQGQALIMLADTSRTPEEIESLASELQKFPAKDSLEYHVAAGSLALRKGELNTAETELRRALEIDPKSRVTHTAMAALYLFRRDVAKAREEMKTAADLSPWRAGERVKYAEFLLAAGDQKAAKDYLLEVTSKVPDFVPAWRLLAQVQVAEKNNQEALASLEHAFQLDPDNPDARMVEAQIRMAMGEPAKAVQNLDRLNKIYPNVPVIRLQLARAHVLNGDFAAAAAVLNQLVADAPDFTEANLLLAEVNLKSGEYQTVINAMQELLKKDPNQQRAQMLMVDAYRMLGQFDQAVAIFRGKIQENPFSPQAYLGLGIVLRQQNKLEEARAALEKALEQAPQNLLAVVQLSETLLSLNDYPAAMKLVEEQLQRVPDSALLYVAKGKILAAQQQFDQAEAAFSKAIELDPNLNEAYDLLVATYMATNRLPQAVEQLESVIKRTPNNVPMLMALGMTYEKLSQFEKARDAYEKLLAIKPDTAPALNNLAYLYAERLQQPQQAVETARKARALQPGDGAVADTLGWALYRQGNYQQAISLLQESASKLPDVPEVQYHLGMAAYMMGEKELARTALSKAVQGKAEFEGRDEAQRRLANIEQGGELPQEVSTEKMEEALQQQPNDLVTANRLAETYERRGENEKAVAAYERVLKVNPKLVSAAVKLAELNGGPLHNKEKALEWAKKARELAPRDPEVASVLGRVAFQSGNFTWAHSLLQESSRQVPENAEIQHQYALAAYSLGKVKEAVEAMQKVVELAPDSAMAADAKTFLALTSDSASAGGNDAEAVSQRMQADPEDVPAAMVQAGAKTKQGETEAAAQIYMKVLTRYPDFAPAQKELAAIYAQDPANLSKAYELAMKARKTLPDDPALLRVLGAISFQKKEYSQAIQQLQQSARKQPLDPVSTYFLGMAQMSNRQREQGVQTLNRALADGLQGPYAESARKVMEEQPTP